MRLHESWTVAMKDLSIFRRKRYILYSLIATPLILSVLLPGSILLSGSSSHVSPAVLDRLLQPELTIFIILAAILPAVIGRTVSSVKRWRKASSHCWRRRRPIANCSLASACAPSCPPWPQHMLEPACSWQFPMQLPMVSSVISYSLI